MESKRVLTSDSGCCPIVELRQYTLRPNARETLIDLFEREFIESQEAVGMCIIGTFRDLEKPDRFVWLRGFQDMESRAIQLQQFYGGAVWKKHRQAANATMIDSDNVLLLRPAPGTSGFALRSKTRPPGGAKEVTTTVIVGVIHYLPPGSETEFAEYFQRTMALDIEMRGFRILAQFITEHRSNTFPALPVREEANVFVWFTTIDHADAFPIPSIDNVVWNVRGNLVEKSEVLLLSPTTRSLLRA